MTDHVVPRVRYGDVIGGDLVAGQHLELLRGGVVDDDERGPVPVIVHEGVVATPELFDGLDEADAHTWFRHRLQIRTMLAGRGAPRVLALLNDARHPDIPVGFVEAHAGDVRLLQLVPRHGFGRALPGTIEAQGAARLPIGICLRIARDLAEPYAVIEAVSGADTLIHVQPRDIFIGDDGMVRSLVDPSAELSRHLGGPDDYSPIPMARLAFMSPERLTGVPIDARDGMHMLGLLLFAVVVGEHPWLPDEAPTPMTLLQAMFRAPLPAVAARRPDVPTPVAQLIERLLRRRPEDRYPDWATVMAAIDDAADRTERATHAEVAAFAAALVPDAMAQTRARREAIAVLDTRALRASLPPHEYLRSVVVDVDSAAAAALAAAWQERTQPEVDAPFLGKDGQAMWGFTEQEKETTPSSARWRIDAAPVSHRAWARFCAETNRAPPTWWRGPMPPLELEELAVGGVSLHEAAAYAAHFGKVVPTDEQWQRALDQLGAARLQVGAIWEWTTTPHLSGVVVRGGRFRDSVDVVSDGSTSSWANRAGPDLGFRCVARDGL
jgi:hypothetical protein